MKVSILWHKWMFDGSAGPYRSTRWYIRRERLRIVSSISGYILLLVNQKRVGAYFDKDIKKYRDKLFGGRWPKNADEFNAFVDQICEREYHQTPEIFYRIIQALYYYDTTPREVPMREIQRESIYNHIAKLETPYAGSIVRRLFREIEDLIRRAIR